MSVLNKTMLIPGLQDAQESARKWNGFCVADAEPIPGYRLLVPLGKGGFGEVWKCEAPGGLPKAAKFVASESDGLQQQANLAEQEFAAFQYVKEIRHPFLLALDRVEFVGQTLVIIMELADQTLHDVFQHCRANGWPGIDRSTLLSYLREAAEALDTLNRRYHLQHLDVKPQNLFLISEHVKVGDFGLVGGFADNPLLKPSNARLCRMTPLYMAPEMASASGFSRTTDQYSLALVYQELLTGVLPFDGKNPRQLLLQHSFSEPNLQPLPLADRPIVARALAKNPEQRFASCLDFVQALASQSQSATGPVSVPGNVPASESASRPTTPSARPSLPGYQFVKCLSRNDVSEDWLIQAGDGRLRRAQVLQVRNTATGRSLSAGLQRLVGLEHPALPPFVVLPWGGDQVALIANHTGQSLRERLAERRGEGFPGLTSAEILGWLRAAARALDELRQHYGLQHLLLNPDLLRREGEHVFLEQFGLAELLWLPAHLPVARYNAGYAPPELFAGAVSPSGDQYSLALMACELLTGVPPTPQIAGVYRVDLRLSPEATRPVLTRALNLDPALRYPSCVAFVDALQDATRGAPERPAAPAFSSASAAGNTQSDAILRQTRKALPQVVQTWLAEASNALQVGELEKVRYLLQPGEYLWSDFVTRKPLADTWARVEGAFRLWSGQLIQARADALEFLVALPNSFGNRWGGQLSLEVLVRMWRRQSTSSATTVQVQIKPASKQEDRTDVLLREVGPLVLKTLSHHLEPCLEERALLRVPYPRPLRVIAVEEGQMPLQQLTALGKDLSSAGIGFFSPARLDARHVRISRADEPDATSQSALARVVRLAPCGDGCYEVGALFVAGDGRVG